MKAFLKKEWMEWSRTGRILILLLIFSLFGVMNPALTKLTPWLIEALSESLADTGLAITSVKIDAMTSWTQFYKNIPIGLLVFLLLGSGSFTAEYQKGTLVPVVTKGLSRRKILSAKSLMLYLMWTVLYVLCFGITFIYNAYFWDNSIVSHFAFAVLFTWLFGIWTISLLIFFSSVVESSTEVLLGTGGVVAGAYVLHMFPKLSTFLPVRLMDGMSLLQDIRQPADYYISMAVAAVMIFSFMILATVCFDRKYL